ncbi:hypothetical protein QBC39DRAFT_147546 [Podospora conica]|nr:hypothetical protein QBC39DRAFT_147546 [Schizothecium conicum]
MQIKDPQPSTILPTKPQIHSHKHHNAYNGTHHLPLAVGVKRSTAASRPTQPNHLRYPQNGRFHARLYAVTLFYEHNRACTIFRTMDDFVALRRGLPTTGKPVWKRNEPIYGVVDMQQFLGDTVAKFPKECALEYFLRRRMGDCGY